MEKNKSFTCMGINSSNETFTTIIEAPDEKRASKFYNKKIKKEVIVTVSKKKDFKCKFVKPYDNTDTFNLTLDSTEVEPLNIIRN